MTIDLLSEKYKLKIKRVYPEDCQLCISGYTGKKCKYLLKIRREFYCIREAVKAVDSRLKY
jgi:hypothetical protein